MSATTQYTPPLCMHCGEAEPLTLSSLQLEAWQAGAMIQDAFPDLSIEAREQIKSGTHAECWDKMFAWMDDEQEEDWYAHRKSRG